MSFQKIRHLTLSVFILAAFAFSYAIADDGIYGSNSGEKSTSEVTQQKLSKIFDGLETIGSNANSGGNAAALAALDTGCRTLIEESMKTKLFEEMNGAIATDLPLPQQVNTYINTKLHGLSQNSLNQICAALKGETLQNPASVGSLKNEFIPQLASWGQSYANTSGIPFLTRLEIETGTSEKSWIGSITSIQPLWQDANDLHHIFAQLSWHKAPDTLSDNGRKTQYDTYNSGLAYRYLTPDKKHLYGANMFFDYAPRRDHTRMSLGVDARTSQLAFSANRYMPLSTWRSVNAFDEERAAAGWDAEIRGQVPELPSWTAILKGYEWDGFEEQTKLYGGQAAVEYSPFPALTARLGVRDESEGSASVEAALRFNWRFDQPEALQFKPRTELAAVSDYVYEKVQRDNIIRVTQRRKHSTKLTVIETTGANSALEGSVTSSLHVGQTLLMPVTVTTANTVGAISRLRLNDGSILTSGQNTQVMIEPNLITLLTGSIQYVNNGIIQTIVVPGGTIALHGTDLDIVSNGTNSSVRVRDGAVTFTGTVSGAANLLPQDMAESIAGVIGTVPSGSATYNTHADSISTVIDWVATPQTGAKVAPYVDQAPYISSQSMMPGQQIVIGLSFNDAVVVSGGTPLLELTVNGVSRTASYVSGSGTNQLLFAYTVQASDAGATSIVVTNLDANSASLIGNGKDSVTTIADTTLPLSGTIADTTAPSGYAIAFTTDPINDSNKTSATLRITSAEVGTTYAYYITSSGGGTTVTGSGTVTTATHDITGIDVSGLNDGTLTANLTLTDTSSNAGGVVTDTVTKDASLPSGYAAAFTTSPITSANKSAAAFDITGAEIGTTYSYTISSSGGGTNVTGSGTVSAATESITGINLTGLTDGTFTLTVTLTDTNGNIGTAVTTTSTADSTPPSGYSVTFTTDPVNLANYTAAAFQFAGAEVGATYSYTISSSGGGTNVTGSGTIATATDTISGLNLTSLNDGTLTVSVTLTDTNSNAGSATTDTVVKDIVAPTITSVTVTSGTYEP